MSANPHNEKDGDGHGHGSRFIQHHYDDGQHQFDTGKLGIWFFLAQEVLFFSALFVAYIVYRHHHPEIFAYAHYYLDVKWGAINTAVLIVSSLSAAWAVRCAQLNQRKGLIFCLAATIVCACGFLGIKYVEYTHKIHEGILFGKKFDPCVSSGGAPLLNKKNDCHGVKTSVVWDHGAKKASQGCLPVDIDKDLEAPGYQADCRVSEVTVRFESAPGQPVTTVEAGRRDVPACEFGGEGEGAHHGGGGHGGHPMPSNAPCFTLVTNPAVCPAGPAAMVHYGDHEVRGPEVQIHAECAQVPPAAAPADPFSVTEPTVGVGAKAVDPVVPVSAHDQGVAISLGPPPEHTNMFFSIYFAMTGLHGIHVLVGIFVFIWLLIRAIKGHFTPDYFGPIDYAALYWHLVDLIWIFLFPLLYLIH